LEDAIECKRNGKEYTARFPINESVIHFAGTSDAKRNSGRKAVVSEDSIEAQIIGDATKVDASYRANHKIVNDHRRNEALPALSLSAVIGCIKRIRPKVRIECGEEPEDVERNIICFRYFRFYKSTVHSHPYITHAYRVRIYKTSEQRRKKVFQCVILVK
jgi:hypothetical protein